jgi:hypothetical protein
MTFAEDLHILELREVAAPMAIMRILLGVRPELRLQVLECVKDWVKDNVPRPASEFPMSIHHPALKNGDEATDA